MSVNIGLLQRYFLRIVFFDYCCINHSMGADYDALIIAQQCCGHHGQSKEGTSRHLLMRWDATMRGTWVEAGLTVLKVCGRGAEGLMAPAGMPWKSAEAERVQREQLRMHQLAKATRQFVLI